MIAFMSRQIRLWVYWKYVLSFLAKDAEQRQRMENPRYVRRGCVGDARSGYNTGSPQQTQHYPPSR